MLFDILFLTLLPFIISVVGFDKGIDTKFLYNFKRVNNYCVFSMPMYLFESNKR